MKEIVLNRDDIPLWTGGDGNLSVFVPGLDLKKPLSPATNEVARLALHLQGINPILIGTPGGFRAGNSRGNQRPSHPDLARTAIQI